MFGDLPKATQLMVSIVVTIIVAVMMSIAATIL